MFKSWTLIIGMLAAGLCMPAASSAQDVIKVTDIAGREVTVKRPLKRIVLGEGRQLIAMALIHPDPVALLRAGLRTFNARTKSPTIFTAANSRTSNGSRSSAAAAKTPSRSNGRWTPSPTSPF